MAFAPVLVAASAPFRGLVLLLVATPPVAARLLLGLWPSTSRLAVLAGDGGDAPNARSWAITESL